MNQRTRISAQDGVLDAIAAKAKEQTDTDVAAAIREIGAQLAKKWGAKHDALPDTRRSAGQ